MKDMWKVQNLKVKNKPRQYHLFHFSLKSQPHLYFQQPPMETKKTTTQMLAGVGSHQRSNENKLEKDGGLFGRPTLEDNYYYLT
jgi:hypothetical protein